MNLDLDFEIGSTPASTATSSLARLISSERDSILTGVLSDRASREKQVRERNGKQLDSFLLLIAVGGDALSWAIEHINGSLENDSEDTNFARYYETLAVLAQRAITTAAEVQHLLSMDLNAGARGRLRTLEEVFLVTAILAVHGRPDGEHPDLIARYREHHRVFARSLAEDLLHSDSLSEEHALTPETLVELENVRDELVGKYGKQYRTLWGWANVLFPANTKINFGKLSRLLDIDLSGSNSLASRHVHASSEGWQEAFGQDSQFDFGYVSSLATGYLFMTLQAVVPASSRGEDGVLDTTGRDWHEALHSLVLEVRD
jgi:hypothetical protein